jgi:hypothetical protein
MDMSASGKHRMNNILRPEFELQRLSSKESEPKLILPRAKAQCIPCENGTNECCNTCMAVLSFQKKKGQDFKDLKKFQQCVDEGWDSSLDDIFEEGCRIRGKLLIPKVDGEIHFAPGESADINGTHIHNIAVFGDRSFDFSHVIHDFDFGMSSLPNPIKGLEVRMSDTEATTFSYFLRLVPVYTRYNNGKSNNGFQLVATRHHRKNAGEGSLPIVTFHYDFSAMAITKVQRRRPLSSFLTGLCAVIGGLYTVSAIVDSLMYRAERGLMAKQGFGKVF